MNTQAINAFISEKAKLEALLARVTSHVEDHFNASPEQINWGHVGEVSDIARTLQEVSDKIFQEGEYAA